MDADALAASSAAHTTSLNAPTAYCCSAYRQNRAFAPKAHYRRSARPVETRRGLADWTKWLTDGVFFCCCCLLLVVCLLSVLLFVVCCLLAWRCVLFHYVLSFSVSLCYVCLFRFFYFLLDIVSSAKKQANFVGPWPANRTGGSNGRGRRLAGHRAICVA